MKKTLLTSILFVALFLLMTIGGTYAMFSSNSDLNFAITTSTIKVEALISDVKLTSLGVNQANSFENGGTLTVDGNSLTMSNISPGDQIAFTLKIKNSSTINIQYRVKTIATGELAQYLSFTPVNINWTLLEPNKELDPIDCTILLPSTVDDAAQGLSGKITIKVEAVQGNADTTVLVYTKNKDYLEEVFNKL